MAETMQSLDQLSNLKPAAPEAPKYIQKLDKKIYYRHTGYAGGIKERSARDIIEGRFPERIVEKAVERMLPRGPLGKKQLGNLRVYKGGEHPHAAQNPVAVDIAKMNAKNARNV